MAQDNVLLLDSSSSKSSSFLEKEAETRQATWLEWLERALRSLPKSIHNPADIARSFLMGRGLPQQQLGWLDSLALYFADHRASRLPFGEGSWSALTANGATLLALVGQEGVVLCALDADLKRRRHVAFFPLIAPTCVCYFGLACLMSPKPKLEKPLHTFRQDSLQGLRSRNRAYHFR